METKVPKLKTGIYRHSENLYFVEGLEIDTDSGNKEKFRVRYWAMYPTQRNISFSQSLSQFQTEFKLLQELPVKVMQRLRPGSLVDSTKSWIEVERVILEDNDFVVVQIKIRDGQPIGAFELDCFLEMCSTYEMI